MSDSLTTPPEGVRVHLLWTKRHHFMPGETFFSEVVPVHALWLVLEGSLEVCVTDGRWNVEAGQVFLGAPCHQRQVKAADGARWLSVGLRMTTAHGFNLLEREGTRILQPQPPASEQLASLLSLLVGASDTSGQGGALLREGLALAVGGWCFTALGQRESGWFSGHRAHPTWLHETLALIEAQPGISVEELAQRAHFSPAQFRRVFASHLGVVPLAYLRQRRLELGRLGLESGDTSLAMVAAQSGWGSGAHFSREFKRSFGMTPLEWRRAARALL